jgi:hypothetical protein
MHTGDPKKIPQLEARAAELASEVARLLNEIDALGLIQTMPAPRRITGPAFEIRRTERGWIVRA